MISREHIAANLRSIRQQIAAACAASSRNDREVTILGASKSQPLERLQWAWDAGLRVFGENRVQEAATKIEALSIGAEWHLIGPLQSNKVRKAVQLFTTVQSVDRLKIAAALDREAAKTGRHLLGFIEVNLAEEETKHGFRSGELLANLDFLADLEALQLVGLMAIPPFEEDPEMTRPWFRRLRELRDEIFARQTWADRPGYLSMGMSHDYTVAVSEGATHVRIGSSLFGPRIT